MGLGQKNLARFRAGQVRSATSGFGKFPTKIPNFFLRFKKISSDWVKKYLGQRQVSPLFTAGQNYAQVGSGPISKSVRHFALAVHNFYVSSAALVLKGCCF